MDKNSNLTTIISALVIFLLVIGAIVFAVSNNSNTSNSSTSTSQSSSYSSNSESKSFQSNMNSIDTKVSKGEFKAYNSNDLSFANEKNSVVIFFNASWCPTCQATVKDINANVDKIDSRLKILSADFDKETDLKKKYSITMQHTFVKVDSQGNLIEKKSGLNTLDEITDFALN
jgi:thiol-disulfide isomerase/thioredoxin